MWGSDHSSRNSNIFIDWLTDSNSILLNTTVPTYRNSTGKTSLIDLTICSSSLYGHTNCYVSDCFFDSDHSPVITEFSLIRPSKRYITQPQIQANIFADFFASKNAYHEPIPLDFFHKEDNNLNKPFHIFEIHRAIKLPKNSTPGADPITASFLKNLDRNGCEIILRYFQELFDNAIVPNSWKHAVILPIPKQCKDKTRISSYRPIALTSIFSKTFERVLTNRLSYFLTTERKLHPQHYGFVPFKDSRSATYLIHKAIMDAKLKKKYFVGVSLDIKSAYDSVYVDGLLYKCL
ncbi:LINE-1 reverse transcriptase homolog [Trichonephila clavipes]|nr:LINE-1 reverse transcriptase homolog [Trichonephila clavipes]